MKRIGLIPNMKKEKALEITRELYEKFFKHNLEIYLTCEAAKAIGNEKAGAKPDVIAEHAELLIVLGGDGTLLKVARDYAKYDIPILGINVGKVGFLTEIEIGEVNGYIDDIVKDNFEIKERVMLETSVVRNNNKLCKFIALNDIVISKGPFSKLIELETYINDSYLEKYPGDGLIVATSTGSTGYSLSAGGPVINPDLDAILVTPICPHILHGRSVVVSPKEKIDVKVNTNYAHVVLTIDGQQGFTLQDGDEVIIRNSEHVTKLVKFNKRSFCDVLNHKLVERKE
ncbi:NAD(+)/NADH kinase [Natranaerofaba carboxydovora]|uniref:NAD(+)/NADH kinase n=1 Tax=Natranaerofaba carboxydovora TaxID=2742683 RepID=UPI001F12DB60|nr:NAD(+)/NADH kinase [Natranaerofaba carboxydovora]UMZ73943.1 NAD kinase [Natranaerofaba carboxydovora]